jgi:hypothetical protein
VGHLPLDAVRLLEGMAEAGHHPQEVAAAPERLALLVQELRRWCAVASSHYALRWDGLCRAGQPEHAEEARRWAEALDQAHRALRLYS